MKFTREDFPCGCLYRRDERHYDWCEAQEAADIANDKIRNLVNEHESYREALNEYKRVFWNSSYGDIARRVLR